MVGAPTRIPRLRLWTVVICLGLIATACASSASTDDDGAPLPMDAVLIEYFGTDDLDAYRRDLQRDVARGIADCMADRGWEYSIAANYRYQPVEIDPFSRNDANALGFGIVADFEQLVAFENGVGLSGTDPNRPYLQTLTADEIQTYLAALQDDPGGCTVMAGDEAWADWERFLQELPWYSGLAEEFDSNPEASAARARWQGCMAELGYDYREPADVEDDVRARLGDDFGTRLGPDPLAVPTADGYELSPPARVILDELSEFERAVAVANFDCSEPDRTAVRSVEREIQRAFVDSNIDAIDRLLGRS